MKDELRRLYKEKIENSYLGALISLHKKDSFNKYLLGKI